MPKPRLSKKRAVSLLEKAERIKKEEAMIPKRTKVVPCAGAGDILAAGGGSASYAMPKVTDEEWNRIFGGKDE